MELTLIPNSPERAMAVMREVAAWGRERGLRLWPAHLSVCGGGNL